MLKVGSKFKFSKKSFVYVVLIIKQNELNEDVIYYIPNYMINTCFLETELKFTDNGKTKYKVI